MTSRFNLIVSIILLRFFLLPQTPATARLAACQSLIHNLLLAAAVAFTQPDRVLPRILTCLSDDFELAKLLAFEGHLRIHVWQLRPTLRLSKRRVLSHILIIITPNPARHQNRRWRDPCPALLKFEAVFVVAEVAFVNRASDESCALPHGLVAA